MIPDGGCKRSRRGAGDDRRSGRRRARVRGQGRALRGELPPRRGRVEPGALHRECAAIATAELGIELDAAQAVELLGDTIRYVAYPDSEGLIAAAHGGGLTVAVVSNADYTLPRCSQRPGSGSTWRSARPGLGRASPTPDLPPRAGRRRDDPRANADGGDTPDATPRRSRGGHARPDRRPRRHLADRDDTIGALTQIAELIQ